MAPARERIRPLVKWVGGKGALLPELLKRTPTRYRVYHEPFLGGGALFFAVRPKEAVLSDINADLIDMYLAVEWAPGLVHDYVDIHLRAHSNEHYLKTRRLWNKRRDVDAGTPWRAATFIYLNRACYNGLWRVNAKGDFNVPPGKYKHPRMPTYEEMLAASKALQSAEVHRRDFRAIYQHAEKGDFVYFDPPYDPVSRTSSFTSYAKEKFGKDDQRGLADNAKALVLRGVKVMLSNSDTKFVRSLYPKKMFRIERVYAPRAINSKATRRGKVAELIITGGY